MHAAVDGVCTNEVVVELVEINYRPHKSWDVLQMHYKSVWLDQGQIEVIDGMHRSMQTIQVQNKVNDAICKTIYGD